MEYQIIQRHFFIVFTGLSLGILGLLFGGFGNVILDKTLHIIMFFAVSFINFYYLKQDKRKHLFKIISLSIFTLIYSAMINPILIIMGLISMGLLILWTKNENLETLVIDRESPLVYGFKKMPNWKIFILFLYCVSVYFL